MWYLVAIVILQLFVMGAIFTLCVIQAHRYGTGIIDQLQSWQSSLAIVVGFSAVIFTTTYDHYKEEQVRINKANAFALAVMVEVGQIEAQLTDIDYITKLALDNRSNGGSCLSAFELIKSHNVRLLGLFQQNREELSLLSAGALSAVTGYYLSLDKLHQEIDLLEPFECSGSGQGGFETVQSRVKHLRKLKDNVLRELNHQ